MKERVAFLGIGQAGSNICEIAECNKYRTAVINTSPEDLEALSYVKSKLLVGVGGGSGKDRQVAKSEVKKYFKQIVNFVEQRIVQHQVDLVFVVFSSGGGTGSGMGPILIDILQQTFPNISFNAMIILPTAIESTISHVNSVECIKELSNLNAPTLMIDNDKCYSPQINRRRLYDAINEAVINDISIILTDKKSPSKYGNLDHKDLLKLLTTPGVLTIGILTLIDETPVTKYSLQKQISRSIDESPYAPIEYNGVVTRIWMIYEASETIIDSIDIQETYKELGTPLELFEGIYINNDESVIISLIAGQSFPLSRVDKMMQSIENSRKLVNCLNKVEIDDSGLSWFNQERNGKSSEVDKVDLENFDILSIFDRY